MHTHVYAHMHTYTHMYTNAYIRARTPPPSRCLTSVYLSIGLSSVVACSCLPCVQCAPTCLHKFTLTNSAKALSRNCTAKALCTPKGHVVFVCGEGEGDSKKLLLCLDPVVASNIRKKYINSAQLYNNKRRVGSIRRCNAGEGMCHSHR